MPISPGTHVVYRVRTGDSLYTIADQFGTSVPSLVQINSLFPPITEPDFIYPGQVLLARLPGTSQQSSVLYQVASGDTLSQIAERFSVGVDILAAVNQIENPNNLMVAQLLYIPAFVYEVMQGDSLFRISRQFGVPMSEVVRANRNRPGFSLDLIYPGFRFVIPLRSSTNVVVFEPLPGMKVASGQRLVGVARAFEATVLYQIRDAMGRIVTRERAITAAEGAPAFGQFETQLFFDHAPTTPTGTLMVYTRSARNGSIQDLVEVPITF
ncbi:LysM peptidoglycan-binding domain-containing protein [Paenibacillus thermotolerans]|uniref:LysM peptidoglycan-binding domain-containing protein n=1 Tax=Paenibacillus thermotolerans TaxID=3027807 RepID=UPI002368C42F|nr:MULTISPECIES: LysM peptidoglycan-binding domain-containing protein [unclassified Paenibacillus]